MHEYRLNDDTNEGTHCELVGYTPLDSHILPKYHLTHLSSLLMETGRWLGGLQGIQEEEQS